MKASILLDRSNGPGLTGLGAGGETLHCDQGICLHEAGIVGTAWRVVAGAIRLDAVVPGQAPMFAGMAVEGDIVGAECLLLGRTHFRATAITPTILSPWPGTAQRRNHLLAALARAEQRMAGLVALRTGPAIERVKKLLKLLAGSRSERNDSTVSLPSLRDMAEITSLTAETVSRSITGLRRRGLFVPEGERRGGGMKTGRVLA